MGRLDDMKTLLLTSHQTMSDFFSQSPEKNTGYAPLSPDATRDLAEFVSKQDLGQNPFVWDLECGVGDFALFAAFFGIPSIGIDLNTHLTGEAAKNVIRGRESGLLGAPVTFATGNIYFGKYAERYIRLGTSRYGFLPQSNQDPYSQLDHSIQDASVLFCHSWTPQHPLLAEMMYAETEPGTFYILRQGAGFHFPKGVKKLEMSTPTMGVWKKVA